MIWGILSEGYVPYISKAVIGYQVFDDISIEKLAWII